jgi:hypothetical protein
MYSACRETDRKAEGVIENEHNTPKIHDTCGAYIFHTAGLVKFAENRVHRCCIVRIKFDLILDGLDGGSNKMTNSNANGLDYCHCGGNPEEQHPVEGLIVCKRCGEWASNWREWNARRGRTASGESIRRRDEKEEAK